MPDFKIGDVFKVKQDRHQEFRGSQTYWDDALFTLTEIPHPKGGKFYVVFPSDTGLDDYPGFQCDFHWFTFYRRPEPTFSLKLNFTTTDIDEAIATAEKIAAFLNMPVGVIDAASRD